ncbi:hypothetical protein FEE95_21270 [Maribacter algarum]|uniref:Uncharacterized protein n=1 Tax=Maribacter algarum (ex Zhang et al. 2020) TaxID=2578118 RepID=A0A5S3PE10_9FLAO|nr:hypothetical protein [Maribacter algarum]TMM52220.1 hypothetical protein FEE95_21270 [Maribacter algarum]
MKTIKVTLFVFLFGILIGHSQTDNKPSNPKKEKKEMNLLDEQTKILGQIFELGGMEEENPIGGSKNYLELIEKSEMPPEQKEQLREMYKVYDLSLDPKKKDSLKLMVDKMLKNAIEKTQNDSKQ